MPPDSASLIRALDEKFPQPAFSVSNLASESARMNLAWEGGKRDLVGWLMKELARSTGQTPYDQEKPT